MNNVDTDQDTESKVHTFSDEELASYVANIQKEKYEEGKTVAIEKTLRNLKQKYAENLGIETEGIKDYEGLISMIAETQTQKLAAEIETLKKERTGETQSIANEYDTKLKALQQTLLDRESELTEIANQKDKQLKSYKVGNELTVAMAKIEFDAEGDLATLERTKAEILFKSLYNIDFDADSGTLIVADRNGIIKDRLQNPEKLSVIIGKFVKDYNIPIKQNGVAKQYTGTKKTNIEFSAMTREKFENQMVDAGIAKNSNEYIAKFSEWRKSQT